MFRFRMWVRFRLGLGEGLGLGTLASVFLSTKWSIESLTGSRDLRGATGFGRATSMPGLALSLSPPLSPQAHSSRTGAEWVCIYYFLFSFTLASVFLSTKWSIDSLTGSSDLRCATGFGR